MSDEERPTFRVTKGGVRGGGRERDDAGYQLRALTADLLRSRPEPGSYDIERQVHELSEVLRAARDADEHGFGIESHVLDGWISANEYERFPEIGSEADRARWS